MASEEIFQILHTIPYVFIGIALLIGAVRFKQQNNIQRKLFALIIITAAVELCSRLLWQYQINNMAVFHVFTVVEFCILTSIYKHELNLLRQNNAIQWIRGAFILFAIANTLLWQDFTIFNSNTLTISSALLIALSVMYFYQLLQQTKYEKLEQNPMFWINSGVLVYFSSCIVLFHVTNELGLEAKQVRELSFSINAIFNVFHYIAFSIALWIRPVR
ncbi:MULTISPECIES: hypothetical protein [Reichenbachiella]|uniref:YhhN-like protein n=1 Tax=Reichenbachiella agariperforans TaxID=156994 RepID=A0A1M6SME5_REIAG|nr:MULTISPECIES: hypothetical protein [Reichenbachiella]MBU2916195.1 hypothetical protein [Reichenbachiella agariperforans]RJE75048.1 hypothetical protein BGP76_18215 [Reichenbachiella sp. MSK19-1]SHK45954.1 hypothetical protein SAMN04488028_10576 [Reichenbachiella agariperforans]